MKFEKQPSSMLIGVEKSNWGISIRWWPPLICCSSKRCWLSNRILGKWQPGSAYDSRTIALARVFEIGYYVVEDDRAVYLDSIIFIGVE